jgi:hypothetical protein
MRRLVVVGLCTVALVVPTACGSSGGSGAGGSTTSSSSRTSTSTTTVAPGQGTTAWTDVTAEWKALAPTPFAKSPELAAEDLAALRRGQDTSEVGEVTVTAVRRGEPAVVVLTESGGPDAAVVSTETEITLEPGDEGWAVSAARQRSTCFRAPTDADATSCS